MEQTAINDLPNRITDLIGLKKNGSEITCQTSFEILPVDFVHRNYSFQAYIFLCRYTGWVDGKDFFFRKCYARGCPHNLCPHVNIAVMIANRYLQRDYQRLKQAGIEPGNKLFTLEDMIVKYQNLQEEHSTIIDIYDYINNAKECNIFKVEVALEFVPAVEHFANYKNSQMFLMADFLVSCFGKTRHFERCLACYPMAKETEERKLRVKIANDRLKLLYSEFDQASIKYNKLFFEF